jgi:hypothetical protein
MVLILNDMNRVANEVIETGRFPQFKEDCLENFKIISQSDFF